MRLGAITLFCKNKLCRKESEHHTYNDEYKGDYVCPHCRLKTLQEFPVLSNLER